MILRRVEDRRTRRVTRTILLGTAALAVGLLWLARELDLNGGELLGYLRTSLLFVGLFALFGIAASVLVGMIRRFRR